MAEWAALAQRIIGLEKDLDKQETNIYIVAGVLGAVDLILIIGLIVLIYAIFQIKKQMQDTEVQKTIEEEMSAQKMAAYTGEEMHRKLLAASNPAVPLNSSGPARGGHDSEYAFNIPFVENRVLGHSHPQQPGHSSGHAGGPSRLHRY